MPTKCPFRLESTKDLSSYDTPVSLAQSHVREESKKIFSSEDLNSHKRIRKRQGLKEREECKFLAVFFPTKSQAAAGPSQEQTSKITYFV